MGTRSWTAARLQVAVSEDQPGQTIELGILRNGQPMTVSVTVGEYQKPGTQVAENEAPALGQARTPASWASRWTT
jgi:serine protease Do